MSLLNLPLLRELMVDDNEFGTEGCSVLAGAVSELHHLKVLSCCSCEITAEGAMILARAASRQLEFDKMELNGNEICERGVKLIKAMLSKASKRLGDMEDNDEEAEDDLEVDEELQEEEEEHQLKGKKDNHQRITRGSDDDSDAGEVGLPPMVASVVADAVAESVDDNAAMQAIEQSLSAVKLDSASAAADDDSK